MSKFVVSLICFFSVTSFAHSECPTSEKLADEVMTLTAHYLSAVEYVKRHPEARTSANSAIAIRKVIISNIESARVCDSLQR